MNHDLIRKIIFNASKLLFVFLVFLLLMTYFQIESNRKDPEERAKIIAQKTKEFQAEIAGRPVNENLPQAWPPAMNNEYPNLALIDQNGKRFQLSSLLGKIVILEYIDFSSPLSQAQSGAALLSPYGASGVKPDEYAAPFKEVLRKNGLGAVDFPGDKVVSLKIIVYGDSKIATVDEAQNWANHFGLKAEDGYIVAVSEKDMRDDTTKSMIGGYQLLDPQLRLRVDSSGPAPKHNLQLTLVPLFEKLYYK